MSRYLLTYYFKSPATYSHTILKVLNLTHLHLLTYIPSIPSMSIPYRSRLVTADRGRSRQVAAGHGRSRLVTAGRGRSRQVAAVHAAGHGMSLQVTDGRGRTRQVTAVDGLWSHRVFDDSWRLLDGCQRCDDSKLGSCFKI